jgi:hypothetical protein
LFNLSSETLLASNLGFNCIGEIVIDCVNDVVEVSMKIFSEIVVVL